MDKAPEDTPVSKSALNIKLDRSLFKDILINIGLGLFSMVVSLVLVMEIVKRISKL